jgi:hypothetical protein
MMKKISKKYLDKLNRMEMPELNEKLLDYGVKHGYLVKTEDGGYDIPSGLSSTEFEDIKKYKELWQKECQTTINLTGDNKVMRSLLEEIEKVSENWYTHPIDNYMDVEKVVEKYRQFKKVK